MNSSEGITSEGVYSPETCGEAISVPVGDTQGNPACRESTCCDNGKVMKAVVLRC